MEVDPRVKRYQKILQSDIGILQDFHQSNITDRKKLISIVGPKSKIDMEALAKYGKVTEVSLDQIFAFCSEIPITSKPISFVIRVPLYSMC